MEKKEEICKAIDFLVSALTIKEDWSINSKIEYAIGWLTSAIINDIDKKQD